LILRNSFLFDKCDNNFHNISKMNNSLYIEYGCGWCAPQGWRNFDSSPTLRFERFPLMGKLYKKNESRFPKNVEYGDIVNGLSIPPNSCKGVYCSHVLEHLSLEDFRSALKNTNRMLQIGGIFRFVLPDLEYLVKQYIDNPSQDAALLFMKNTMLGHEKRKRGLKGLIFSWLGNSQHLWMWDYKSIEVELRNTGFVQIRRAFRGDYSDNKFQEVENMERWNNCLGVECKK